MPNYCFNKIGFGKGGKLEKLVLDTLKNMQDNDFFFSRFIPCPEDLKIDADSYTTDFDADFEFQFGYGKTPEEILSVMIQRMFERCRTFDENVEKMLCNCVQGYINKKKYGYATWYAWAHDNWGTKWDIRKNEIRILENIVYDHDEYTVLEMETANSAPVEFLQHISRQYPEEKMYIYFFTDFDDGEKKYALEILHGEYTDLSEKFVLKTE